MTNEYHRHEHAVRRRRPQAAAHRWGRRQPDRDRLQRWRRLPRPRRRPRTAPARFIFACEDGMIRAWAPTVPRGWSTRAQVAVDSGASGALFRGLALAHGRLYVTDFHNDRVLMFDSHWRPVRRRAPFATPAFRPGTRRSASPPSATASSSPTPTAHPSTATTGPSGGYVDEFDLDGRLVAHVGHNKRARPPWGLALAPEGFGRLGGDLLVANFGSERINVYATQGHGWAFRGRLPGQGPRRLGDRLRDGGRRAGAPDDALLRSRPAPLARRNRGRCRRRLWLDRVRVRRTRTHAPRARPARRSAAGMPLDPRSARSPSQRRTSPSSRRSWRIVVSGGYARAAASRSSNPMTATSFPGSSPASRIAWRAASAIGSDAATIAVGRSESASSAHASR